MTNRSVIVAVVLAALALAGAWLTMPAPRARAPVADPVRTFTLGIDVPSIERVAVEGEGGAASAAFDTRWTITLPAESGPVRWPAEADAVRAMLRQLATTPLEPRDPGPPGEPLATVVLETETGATYRIDAVGPALAGMIPLRLETPDGVRHAAGPGERLRPLSVGDIAALARPRPFDAEGVIDRVGLTPAGGDGVELVRRAGVWSLAGLEARVDQEAARALVDRLRGVRASSIVMPQETGSLGEVSVRISAGVQRPRLPGEPARSGEIELAIGEQASLEGDVYALARRAFERPQALLITLNAETFPEFSASPSAYLDPSPLPWPAAETGSVVIRRGEVSRRFRRTLGGWTSDEGPADSAAIRTLIGVLGGEHPVGTAAETGVALATLTVGPVGAGEPVTVTVRESADGLVITDGAAAWTVEGPELRDAIERLAG